MIEDERTASAASLYRVDELEPRGSFLVPLLGMPLQRGLSEACAASRLTLP